MYECNEKEVWQKLCEAVIYTTYTDLEKAYFKDDILEVNKINHFMYSQDWSTFSDTDGRTIYRMIIKKFEEKRGIKNYAKKKKRKVEFINGHKFYTDEMV